MLKTLQLVGLLLILASKQNLVQICSEALPASSSNGKSAQRRGVIMFEPLIARSMLAKSNAKQHVSVRVSCQKDIDVSWLSRQLQKHGASFAQAVPYAQIAWSVGQNCSRIFYGDVRMYGEGWGGLPNCFAGRRRIKRLHICINLRNHSSNHSPYSSTSKTLESLQLLRTAV